MEEMSLAVKFDDQSDSFVHGYECGVIGRRMESAEHVIDYGVNAGFPLHTANLEVVKRLCAFYDYTFYLLSTDDEWSSVVMTKVQKSRPALRAITGGLSS